LNWRLKAAVQQVVAHLPLSDRVYFGIQRSVGNLRPGQQNPREWFRASTQLVEWLQAANRPITDARFLEVGTGRHLSLPIALWLHGAGRVITVDLNRYLSQTIVTELQAYIRQHAVEIEGDFGSDRHDPAFVDRWRRLLAFSGSLTELMEMTKIEYLAPADARRLHIPAASIDCHLSYTVLEHIPADVIVDILREAGRVLRPGGVVYHVIDPSDHFSHADASITAVNFLRFSEREWKLLAGNKYSYHNRLRATQHRELFAKAGVSLLRTAEVIDEPALKALQGGFPTHTDFRTRPIPELATRGITVLGEFSGARGGATAGSD
jgi:SAM-dependent methyltransferase